MMNYSMKPLFSLILLLGLAPVASAAILAPQLGGFIDPNGGGEWDFDATGSVPITTFQAFSKKVIQANWAGVGGLGGNVIDHDPNDGGNDQGVDVRITHLPVPGFTVNPAGGNANSTNDPGTGYRWLGTDGQSLNILFGTEDSGFTNDRTVQAAGMMLMNFGSAYTDVTINYLDPNNSILSSQSFSGTGDLQDSTGADFFTGYSSSSANIARITVAISRNPGDSNIALDALVFVLPDTLAGDFNGDGRVDGFDFLEWQRDPGVGSLSDWEANYGQPLAASATAVPEPSLLMLLLGGLSAVGGSRLGRPRSGSAK